MSVISGNVYLFRDGGVIRKVNADFSSLEDVARIYTNNVFGGIFTADAPKVDITPDDLSCPGSGVQIITTQWPTNWSEQEANNGDMTNWYFKESVPGGIITVDPIGNNLHPFNIPFSMSPNHKPTSIRLMVDFIETYVSDPGDVTVGMTEYPGVLQLYGSDNYSHETEEGDWTLIDEVEMVAPIGTPDCWPTVSTSKLYTSFNGFWVITRHMSDYMSVNCPTAYAHYSVGPSPINEDWVILHTPSKFWDTGICVKGVAA